jgi:hypothetical protein
MSQQLRDIQNDIRRVQISFLAMLNVGTLIHSSHHAGIPHLAKSSSGCQTALPSNHRSTEMPATMSWRRGLCHGSFGVNRLPHCSGLEEQPTKPSDSANHCVHVLALGASRTEDDGTCTYCACKHRTVSHTEFSLNNKLCRPRGGGGDGAKPQPGGASVAARRHPGCSSHVRRR